MLEYDTSVFKVLFKTDHQLPKLQHQLDLSQKIFKGKEGGVFSSGHFSALVCREVSHTEQNNRLQCQDGAREAAREKEIIAAASLTKLLHCTVTPGASHNLCYVHPGLEIPSFFCRWESEAQTNCLWSHGKYDHSCIGNTTN